jgi:hypothetical protein
VKLLTRDQILDANDLPSIDVDVPEWGGKVRVCTMSAFDRLAWEQAVFPDGQKVDSKQFVASLAARCIVDEEGKPLFTVDDLDALGGKSMAALNRVREAATKLNAVSPEAAKEIEKNSDAAPAGDGSSN